MTIPVEQGRGLSDVELLRRAVTHSLPYGFGVIEKWRSVAMLFDVDAEVAQGLCRRFGVDPDKLVAQCSKF
jgi:hypothetical protein